MSKANSVLEASLHASVWAQVVTGAVVLIVLVGAAVPDPPLRAVWQILALEMTVQAIEFVFYVTWIRRAQTHDMARVRYFDWFLTTPVMLFTIAAYTRYVAQMESAAASSCGSEQQQQQQQQQQQHSFVRGDGLLGFLRAESSYLSLIAAANLAMLLFGFAAELGHVSRLVAFVCGFAGMAAAFGILWQRYARHSEEGRRLFAVVSVVWSMYGLAFLAEAPTKNAIYSGLDVVAKNFFGIFLAYKLVEAIRRKENLHATRSTLSLDPHF